MDHASLSAVKPSTLKASTVDSWAPTTYTQSLESGFILEKNIHSSPPNVTSSSWVSMLGKECSGLHSREGEKDPSPRMCIEKRKAIRARSTRKASPCSGSKRICPLAGNAAGGLTGFGMEQACGGRGAPPPPPRGQRLHCGSVSSVISEWAWGTPQTCSFGVTWSDRLHQHRLVSEGGKREDTGFN